MDVEVLKKISNWPSESLRVFSLFLEEPNKILTYEDIANRLGLNPDKLSDKEGKSIGGILSTLKRNNLEGKPLIISLGRLLGTRRLQWRLNKAFSEETRSKLLSRVNEILKERSI